MALVLNAACDRCGFQAEWTAAVRHGNIDVDGNPVDDGWSCDLDGEICPACVATGPVSMTAGKAASGNAPMTARADGALTMPPPRPLQTKIKQNHPQQSGVNDG